MNTELVYILEFQLNVSIAVEISFSCELQQFCCSYYFILKRSVNYHLLFSTLFMRCLYIGLVQKQTCEMAQKREKQPSNRR